MLHAYVERFDVMGGRGNYFGLGWGSEQGLSFLGDSVSGVQQRRSAVAAKLPAELQQPPLHTTGGDW
jgi:hypothetical protein